MFLAVGRNFLLGLGRGSRVSQPTILWDTGSRHPTAHNSRPTSVLFPAPQIFHPKHNIQLSALAKTFS